MGLIRKGPAGLAVPPLDLHVVNVGSIPRDLLGIVVQPLDLHLVNVGSIPTGPTHSEGRLQPHPGDLKHPECPEEPQIRLESGGEAERSPDFFRIHLLASPPESCVI